MTRFYNSGLYLTPFFTKHKEVDLTLFDNEYLHEEIEYNADLFAEYFKGGLVEQCKYNPKRKINNEFLKYIPTWPRYYEPLIFEEEIALECGLIPFVLKVDRCSGSLSKTPWLAFIGNNRLKLNDDEINSIKKTLKSAYYTPPLVVKFMWTALIRMGLRGGDVLEPAIGIGAFLDHMPQKLKQLSNVEGVEIDQVTCNILIRKYPEINLICSGFENVHFGSKKYDLIISNPPYGRNPVNDIFNPDLTHLIIHHWFVAKSARMLKDKGVIAMVLPNFFLDNVQDHARNFIYDAGVDLISAYRLPDDLFANAKVTVDIVFLQKAKTNINWLKTKKITIGNDTKSINEYFVDKPENIMGELAIVPMYARTGITCKSKGDLRDRLYQACLKIDRLV